MLSPHFTEAELACKCGCGTCVVSARLLDLLERIRVFLMRPVVIRSGCRCPAHNTTEPDAKPDSAHLATPDGVEQCEAADLEATSSRDRFEIIQVAIVSGCVRMGIGKDFLHVDVDLTKPQEVVWLY